MPKTIHREDLQALINQREVTVVDALPETYFDQQHLPTAINLVADDVAARAATMLPDKSAAIVTYCTGPGCSNSHVVANLLLRAGYTNVRKYADGIQDWVEAGLPTESSR